MMMMVTMMMMIMIMKYFGQVNLQTFYKPKASRRAVIMLVPALPWRSTQAAWNSAWQGRE